VPSFCPNPLPGTITIPVFSNISLQYNHSPVLPISLAFLNAPSGRVMVGNAYSAPSIDVQLTPSSSFSTCHSEQASKTNMSEVAGSRQLFSQGTSNCTSNETRIQLTDEWLIDRQLVHDPKTTPKAHPKEKVNTGCATHAHDWTLHIVQCLLCQLLQILHGTCWLSHQCSTAKFAQQSAHSRSCAAALALQ